MSKIESKWLVSQNSGDEGLGEDFIATTGVPRSDFTTVGNIGVASYHHGKAMNTLVGSIDTRFALFLDPDFFIVPSIDECIEHMLENDLAFFGAPNAIDPRKTRYQDFPFVFCMFVDTHKVDKLKLDFVPDGNKPDWCGDTSHKIYEQFNHLPHDVALPSFAGDTKYKHTNHSIANKYNMRYDHSPRDEYFWKDRLFGVHFRAKLHCHPLLQTLGEKNCIRLHLNLAKNIVQTGRKYDEE